MTWLDRLVAGWLLGCCEHARGHQAYRYATRDLDRDAFDLRQMLWESYGAR